MFAQFFFAKNMNVTGNSKFFDFCHNNKVNETIAKENYANENRVYRYSFLKAM